MKTYFTSDTHFGSDRTLKFSCRPYSKVKEMDQSIIDNWNQLVKSDDFGHIHEKCLVKQFGLNVGMDCHYFKPATIETILFYKNAIENHYDEDVFIKNL